MGKFFVGSIVAIFVFFILVLGYYFQSPARGQILVPKTTPAPKLKPKPPPVQVQTKKAKSEPVTQSLFEKLKETTRDIKAERDPFAVPVVAADGEEVKKIYLTGILWDENHPTAILNNVMVTVGDTIEDQTVKSIQKDRVIIEKDGHETELYIGL